MARGIVRMEGLLWLPIFLEQAELVGIVIALAVAVVLPEEFTDGLGEFFQRVILFFGERIFRQVGLQGGEIVAGQPEAGFSFREDGKRIDVGGFLPREEISAVVSLAEGEWGSGRSVVDIKASPFFPAIAGPEGAKHLGQAGQPPKFLFPARRVFRCWMFRRLPIGHDLMFKVDEVVRWV